MVCDVASVVTVDPVVTAADYIAGFYQKIPNTELILRFEIDYYRNGGILHKILLDYVEEDKAKNS